MSALYEVDGPRLRMHLHPGQVRAWESERRFIGIVAGTQSGKTSFTPLWLWREIGLRGPGDYGFVCPTFTLMEQKALPEFKRLFEHTLGLGTYQSSPVRKFTFSRTGALRHFGRATDGPTQVFFGYAENPDSLESSTYKAVVCDEAGQKAFRRGSWEAINRRVSIHQGRVLIATTPYESGGWLRTEIYDRWKAGDRDVDFIQFASVMNPAFPRAEYDRARRVLPLWRFNLFYRGAFDRPAGLIYDCFDPARHTCPRFAIRPDWVRMCGLDFGGQNTAAVFFAVEPKTGRLYAYREYGPTGGRTAAQHAAELLRGEEASGIPITAGGAKSEQQWRDEFCAAGLPVAEPDVSEVEVGINRCYGAFATDKLMIFSDLAGLRDELGSYSRELDEMGMPTVKIESKEDYHLCDAMRYILPSAVSDAGPADTTPTVVRT